MMNQKLPVFRTYVIDSLYNCAKCRLCQCAKLQLKFIFLKKNLRKQHYGKPPPSVMVHALPPDPTAVVSSVLDAPAVAVVYLLVHHFVVLFLQID